jgi:surface protein
MSLRQQGWGSLAFVPPIPTPNISKKRIWKIPQTQEPEDYFEDAKEDQDEEDDQFEDAEDYIYKFEEKTYDDLENELENKSAAKKEINRRNQIFRYIVTTFFKKKISDIGDESVEYLARISNTDSEKIIRFIEKNESTIDSEIKTSLRKAKEEQPEFYKTERSLKELVGIDKTNSDTLSWLYIINSMGFDRKTHTFDSSKRFLEWDIETINYQKNIIDNLLYTSRVHDLLDLRRQGNQLAGILLKRLVDRTTDEYESRFLLGKEKYLSFTDESLREYIKRWISGNIDDSNPIKYWDVRMVTNMKNLFYFYNEEISPDKHLIDLTYWDVSNVIDMSYIFLNSNFIITGIKNWNTKNVKDMSRMFEGLDTFNEDIGFWDTSNVTNMNGMFFGATSFNQNIGDWITTNVTDMGYMFYRATSFNQYIGWWDTGNVRNMSHIFEGASSFNQDIGEYWDTGNVNDMSFMFYNATSFNQDIGFWDTSNVINTSHMFYNSTSFNQDIEKWDTSNVMNTSHMFYNANLFNQDIGKWDTSNVWDMSHMFEKAISFNQNIGKWETSNVNYMSHMFQGASSFNQNIGKWETRNVSDMSHMFQGASSFNQNIGKWETSNVNYMSHMFQGASSFNQNIGKWETRNVSDMSHMFQGASSFNQNIGKWETSNVNYMSHMFEGASSFNQNIGKWETRNVSDMSHMFQGASSFNQNIGKWETSNVWDMSHMFQEARSFNQNIGKWKTGNVWDMSHMFEKAISFDQDIGTWKTGNVRNMNYIFEGAISFNQNISSWDISNVIDKSHINRNRQEGIIEEMYDEVPSRISSELHMMIPTIESETTFRGTPLNAMIAMMYLLHNYPQYCVVIPPSSYVLNGLNFNVTFKLISLEWNQQTKDIDIPDGFWDSVKQCLQKKPKPNFIIMPFGLPEHANYLIYDSNTKELERFDPNGFTPGEECNPPNLEKKLKDLFNSNVQEGMIEKVYAPMSFCPRRSFQALQGSEGEEKPGDPGGFCAAWAAWYADTRLANPNKTRKQVVEMGLKKFEDEPGSMTEYIRSYSVFIITAEKLLRKSNDPASVFRLLIEKSKYT